MRSNTIVAYARIERIDQKSA